MGVAMNAKIKSAAGAALLLVSLVAVTNANAASFSIVCNTDCTTAATLPSNFDPSGIAAINADGMNIGTGITIFYPGTTKTEGLFVSPQNVYLTFTYMGYEAGYTNVSAPQFAYGGIPMFTNKTTSSGTSTVPVLFNVLADPGLVPFLFETIDGGNLAAVNGGAIADGLSIAFAIVPNTNNSQVYAFFDDGGAGPDKDYDDMVVRITATNCIDCAAPPSSVPVPATLPLFASGLGALGLLSWRRKRKAQLAA